MDKPFSVRLAHEPNPDIAGGYWDGKPADRTKRPNVDSFEHASQLCRDYIEQNNLGAGNWAGGQVYDAQGKQIAHVSYNGRVWEGKRSEFPTKEIKFND